MGEEICFVGSGSVGELLIEIFHLKDYGFRFIGERCNKKQKGFSDVRDDFFKLFSGINWSDGSVRDWSVAGERKKDGNWVLSQRVQESGT